MKNLVEAESEFEIKRLAALILSSFPESSILNHIYNDKSSYVETRNILKIISSMLPEEQGKLVRFVTARSFEDFEQLVILHAALTRPSTNNTWIHYALCKCLDRMVNSGVSNARMPCLLHCLLVLENGGGLGAEIVPRTILAQELLRFSPRDSLKQGLLSLMEGHTDAKWAVRGAALALDPLFSGDVSYSGVQELFEWTGVSAAVRHPTVSLADAASVESHSIFSETICEFSRPKGDAHHYIFREAERPIPQSKIQVYEITDGTISVDVTNRGAAEFYVFDKNNMLIQDLSYGYRPFIIDENSSNFEKVAVLDDEYAGTFNVCHFLLDKLPRVKVYESCDGAKNARFLLFDCHDYYNLIFDKIDRNIVPVSGKKFSIKARRLFISSDLFEPIPAHPAHNCASWAINFLDEIFGSGSKKSEPRKIFISRQDAAGRQIINWPEVEKLVLSHGYEIFTLGNMTINDQIEAFKNATHVVGVHGAGMTNILFSAKETHVLEILPPLVATRAYWMLATSRQQNYHCLIASDPEYPTPNYETWTHLEQYIQRDILICPDSLDKALKILK